MHMHVLIVNQFLDCTQCPPPAARRRWARMCPSGHAYVCICRQLYSFRLSPRAWCASNYLAKRLVRFSAFCKKSYVLLMASATPVVLPVSATAAGHLGIVPVTPADCSPSPILTPPSTAPVTTTPDLTSPSAIPQQPPDGSCELPVDPLPQPPSPGGLDSSHPQGVSAPAHQVDIEDEGLDVAQKRAPGRQSWAKGTKAKYLQSMEDDWRTASETGPEQARKFYDRCTNGFLHKFGYDHPLEEDHPSPNPDPTHEQLAAPPPAPPGITEEQAVERSLYTRILRQVRLTRCSSMQLLTKCLENTTMVLTSRPLRSPFADSQPGSGPLELNHETEPQSPQAADTPEPVPQDVLGF